MKLHIIKQLLFSAILVVGVFFMAFTSANAQMSPRSGHVLSPTGTPISGVKVIEYTDWCPPHFPQRHSLGETPQYASCQVPQNCYVERTTTTDSSGKYYFEPWTPVIPAANSSNPCDLNVWWMYTCWNPRVSIKAQYDGATQASGIIPAANAQEQVCVSTEVTRPVPNQAAEVTTELTCTPVPACNVMCEKDGDCAGAKDGCTTCSGGVCRPPVACNSSCTDSSECALAPNGCTSCEPSDDGSGKVCRPAAACNVACVRDDQCAGAKDGCTSCVPNNAGTGSVCAPPPACGVGCERDDQCAGSKDGCTVCAPDDAGKKICQTPFDENACKCDGFNALNLQNPTNSNFQFESFGKVEGGDVNKAVVKSIQFQMTKSSKSNPNSGSIIATSAVMTPQVVSSTADKVRYRSTWSVTPPAYDPNAVYRVFSTIKCGRKPATASASLGQVLGEALYNSDNSLVQGQELNYSPAKLVQNDQNLQLGTLEDGYFTKITETDSCRFIRFEYGQY